MELSATVVIPTFNRPEPLRRVLESLNNQTAASRFEVIVVDDGSSTDTPGVIRSLQLDYRCRWFWQPNAGFRAATARNTGILFAAGDTIIFLDDDMVVQSNFVQSHLRMHESYEESAVIGLRSRVPHRIWTKEQSQEPLDWDCQAVADPRASLPGSGYWQRHPWAFFATCNASVSRQALFDGGLFDEAFQGWGFEDTELAYRLHSIGLRFELLSEPVPYHLETAEWDLTAAQNPYRLPSEKMSGYRRNSAYFASKYSDDASLQRLLDREENLRMLADKTFAPTEEVDRGGDALSDGATFDGSVACPIVPEHLSLLTPYNESDELKGGANVPIIVSGGRSSLLRELEHDFGFVDVGKGGPSRWRMPDWVWTVAMTPVVATLCVALVLALIVTGRYRRIFRRGRRWQMSPS